MATAPAAPTAEDEQRQRAAESRRRQRLNELRLQSFPAKCRELLVTITLPGVGLTKDLQSAIDAHAADVAQIRDVLEKSLGELASAIADAEISSDFTALANAVDALKIDRPLVTQRIVKLWSVAVELAERRLAEVKQKVEPAIAEAEKVVAEVKEQLTAIGSGLESMDAYRDNRHAAERQFEFHVRKRNTRARAAVAAAAGATAEVTGAHEAVYARRRGLEAAKEFLRREMLRIASA